MPLYIVKTEVGTFKVSATDDVDVDIHTRELSKIGKIITVGGANKCVGIKASFFSDTAHLLNVKRTGGGCELEGKEISGPKTVFVINLAFTFLKKEMSNIKYIKLEDCSDIPCSLNNGTVVGISLAAHQLLFHQKTWYERYFNAYLINPDLRKIYASSKINFTRKPKTFDFYNPSLNILLQPLFHDSTSWEDFLSKINKMENKCEIIFFWYSQALKEIFNNISFERQDWMIDLTDIKLIDYTVQQIGGGKRKTRKSYTNTTYLAPLSSLSFDEVMNYKFRSPHPH